MLFVWFDYFNSHINLIAKKTDQFLFLKCFWSQEYILLMNIRLTGLLRAEKYKADLSGVLPKYQFSLIPHGKYKVKFISN